ncbi:MAG: M28 family peptidase [Anaerolineaceae bacterium]
MIQKRKSFIFILLILFLTTGCIQENKPINFSGDQAYQYLQTLLSFGPRIPGSSGRERTASYIKTTLEENDWFVTLQDFQFDETALQNIIAKKGNSDTFIIIGAHYDSRAVSDQENDIEKQADPVTGANDGGSGTAILLELSRVLEVPENTELWLVFFDAEDQGNLNGWNWSIGADYFVHQLQDPPSKTLIIDMIGDEDLNIYQEKNSSSTLVDEIWNVAADLNYQSYLIPQYKYAMMDDHLPFINAGYPTALLIDFDYPYWHTTSDTIDHVSSKSLQIIGNLLVQWLSEQK